MKITDELRDYIFAQYWGQTYVFDKYAQVSGKFQITERAFPTSDSSAILLKPLNKISDEDAIECLNILMGSPGDYYENWHFQLQRDWLRIVKVELVNGFGSVQMNVKPYFHNVWKVFQYLQSKGYDIPRHELEGKTLEYAGLAIYESK